MPFTTDQFFAVFAAYNAAIWPMQLVASALGLAGVALLFWRPAWADRAIAGILGTLWLFTGLAYHALFFAPLNPAAYGFAALFVFAAGILFVDGVARDRMRFVLRSDAHSIVALGLIGYGLAAYPAAALLLHPYPATPLFGVTPCPTTIVTLGFLMLAHTRRPLLLGGVVLLWSVIGGSAAVLLDVPLDWGLLVAGAVWFSSYLLRRRIGRRLEGSAA